MTTFEMSKIRHICFILSRYKRIETSIANKHVIAKNVESNSDIVFQDMI